MNLLLTPRDWDLISTLTCRVRILTALQVANLWAVSRRNRRVLRRRMKRLADAGLLELYTINAHVLSPARPLFAWRPESPEPDARLVSRKARARWSSAAVPTLVCVAAPLVANLLGSTSCGLPKPEHRDHDLLLAAVYVHYRTQHPKTAALWTGEHILPKAGYRTKDPDAFLRNAQGQVIRIIESAGSYSPKQVESFHEHCAEQELPYELW